MSNFLLRYLNVASCFLLVLLLFASYVPYFVQAGATVDYGENYCNTPYEVDPVDLIADFDVNCNFPQKNSSLVYNIPNTGGGGTIQITGYVNDANGKALWTSRVNNVSIDMNRQGNASCSDCNVFSSGYRSLGTTRNLNQLVFRVVEN